MNAFERYFEHANKSAFSNVNIDYELSSLIPEILPFVNILNRFRNLTDNFDKIQSCDRVD